MKKIFGMVLFVSFIEAFIIGPLSHFSIFIDLASSIMFYWIVLSPYMKADEEKKALKKYEEYEKKRKEYIKEISGKGKK